MSREDNLKESTRRWFAAVLAEGEFSVIDRQLLLLAAEAWDEYLDADYHVRENGLCARDRFEQWKPNPAVAIRRGARRAFLDHCKVLRDRTGVKVGDPDEGSEFGL